MKTLWTALFIGIPAIFTACGNDAPVAKIIVTDQKMPLTEWPDSAYVAGLEHHCTKKDIGYFTGRIFNEADNAYDKKAMAIGSNQAGKIIGYVPAAVLAEYRKWCKRQDCRCVGYIFFDGEHLRGRVRVYLPDTDPEKLIQDVEAYIKLAAEHFGWNVDGAQIEI